MSQMISSYLLSICNASYRVLPTVPLWTTDIRAQCWWGLSTHCGKAKGRRWCVHSSRSSSLLFELLTLILHTAGHLSPSVLLFGSYPVQSSSASELTAFSQCILLCWFLELLLSVQIECSHLCAGKILTILRPIIPFKGVPTQKCCLVLLRQSLCFI